MAYTLSNLETDIKNYTEVDDTVLSSSVLNTIIKNGEYRIYRDADSDDNRFYATSTLVTGNRYVTIPSDLRSIRYVQLKDTNVTPNVQTFLEKKDASYMATYYDTPATQSGIPKYYANWDANFWVVAPTPNADYNVELHYNYRPASLTTLGDSEQSWLSENAPNAMLFGALVEGAYFLKSDPNTIGLYELSLIHI